MAAERLVASARCDRSSSVRSTCSRRAGGRIAASFSNASREVRVVRVGVADHQPRREDDRHRLAPGELQRRQERLGLEPPAAALRPERHPELALDRAEVAVHRPDRRIDPVGDLLRSHPVRVGVEEGQDARHPRQAVALAEPRSSSMAAIIAAAAAPLPAPAADAGCDRGAHGAGGVSVTASRDPSPTGRPGSSPGARPARCPPRRR